jgi:predicted RNase H-like HicB family nuclease
MSKYGFNLLWSEEDQGFIVTCPDFPGLSAFGESPEEALSEAKIALELFITSLQATGDSLPKPTECFDYSGQIRFRMPKTLHSSLAHQAEKECVSLNTWLITLLSERNATTKLVDKVCSRIDNVEKAIHVHRAETKQIRIQQETSYTPQLNKGGEYGKVTSYLN